jgi:hypothetical protein
MTPFLHLQVCLSCGFASLVGSTVTCLPGNYSLTYSVTNDAGVTATATRSVTVYSAGQLSLQLPLYENLANGTAAEVTAQALTNAASVEAAAATNSVARRLSPSSTSGLGVQPADVSFLQAQVVQLGPSNYSLLVNATVYVYFPSTVHRGDIMKAAVGVTAAVPGAPLRRALLGAAEGSLPSTVTLATMKHTAQRKPPTAGEVATGIHAMNTNLGQLAAAVTAEAQVVQALPGHATSPRGRRLLQVAETGIAAQLASMTAAASRSLGALNVTSQQTSAAVDPIVVSARHAKRKHVTAFKQRRVEPASNWVP